MKKIAIILLAVFGFSMLAEDAAALPAKKRKRVKTTRTVAHKPAPKPAPAKTLDDGTTGVMGKDQVKMNDKGKNRNMNANTGVALPPSDGGGR